MTNWRAMARRAIRKYPELLRAEADIREGKITPAYSGMPSSASASSTTEVLAMKELPRDAQRDLNAVRQALDTIRRYRTADLRRGLIELVYWRQTHTVDGAGMVLHISQDTAHKYDREFVEMVDAYRRIK